MPLVIVDFYMNPQMSIADNFADVYIEYLNAEPNRFNMWITDIYPRDVLHGMIVELYWRLSEAYDMYTTQPVPDFLWLPMMNYNIRFVVRYMHNNPHNYNPADPVGSIKTLFGNGFEVITDENIILPVAGYPFCGEYEEYIPRSSTW